MTTDTNDQPTTNTSGEDVIDNNVDNVVENEDDNENENNADNDVEDEDEDGNEDADADEDEDEDEDEMNTNKLGKRLMNTNFENKKHMKEGTAFDVIVVEGGEDGSTTLYENSDFLVSFKGEKIDNGGTIIDNHDPNKIIVMELVQDGDDTTTSISEKVWFQINKGRDGGNTVDGGGDGDEEEELPLFSLKSFLKPGRNPIRYLLLDKQQRIVLRAAQANIFLWNYQDSVVVSDIDGTVTKSNAKGSLGTIVTNQYGKVCHDGICHLLTTLSKHKSSKSSSSSTIRVVYVTSRPISLANQTRQLLSGLKQGQDNNESNLPDGPLLGFGGKMSKVLMMEVISHSTNEFKSTKLWQQVVKPFREANAKNNNNDSAPTFVAGFGNTFKDVQAYHAIGIDLDRIYMIDKKSQIVSFDRKIDTDNDNNNSITCAALDPTDDNFIFQPEKFYKNRIGTEFNGYTDAKLLYQFGFYDSDEDKKAQIKKYLVA
jgi:hypothetical protein